MTSSSPYGLGSFKGLSRFVDDAFYLLQKDGRGAALFAANDVGIARRLVQTAVLGLQLLVIAVVAWTLVRLVLYGYPRNLYDLFTLSFYRSEDLDAFLSERRHVARHLDVLTGDDARRALTAYASAIHGTPDDSGLVDAAREVKAVARDVYGATAKYDDALHEALRDYYLYHDRVYAEEAQPRELRHADRPVERTKAFAFYELLTTVKVRRGQIKRVAAGQTNKGSKGDDQLVYEVFAADRKAGFKAHADAKRVRAAFDKLAAAVRKIHEDALVVHPAFVYVGLPDSDRDVRDLSAAVQRGDRHPRAFAIAEVARDPSASYDASLKGFAQVIRDKGDDAAVRTALVRYVGSDPATRARMRRDPTLWTEVVRDAAAFLEDRPLFAYVHLNGHAKDLYVKVVRAHRVLMGRPLTGTASDPPLGSVEDLTALRADGSRVKQTLLAASVLHLYLDVYRPTMTLQFEKQYLSDNRFFQELWKPFVDDLLVNRLGNRYKRTFVPANVSSSYRAFRNAYKRVGDDLKRMTRSVFKAFFVSTPVGEPQMVETDDGQRVTAE